MHVFSNYMYSKKECSKPINKKADEELPSFPEEKLIILHLQLQENMFTGTD